MNKKLSSYALIITISAFSISCNREPKIEKGEPAPYEALPPASQEMNTAYEFKTFEVKDDAQKVLGWGYDIYINGERKIHQPTIPAVSGVHYFKDETEARTVAAYATNKMKSSGSFPTLSINELDSLGIKL
jgi:hypothetical protein